VVAMRLLKSSVEVSRAGGGLLTCSLQAVANLNWLSAVKKKQQQLTMKYYSLKKMFSCSL